MPKIPQYNTLQFLRYAHPRCVKCLFANIRKQWNTLKISLIFKKNTNFMGKKVQSSQDLECEIFRVLFSHERNHIGRFSNLHWCTFKFKLSSQEINIIESQLDNRHFVYSNFPFVLRHVFATGSTEKVKNFHYQQ